MSKCKRRRWLAGAAALLALTPFWAAADEAVKTPLTPVEIPSRHQIVSPCSGGGNYEVFPGVAVAFHQLLFDEDSREKAFTVAGRPQTLIWNGKDGFTLKNDAGSVAIPSGFQGKEFTTPIDLGNGRKYVLAFTRVYSRAKSEDNPGMGMIAYACGTLQQGRIGQDIIGIYDFDTDGFYTFGKDVYRLGGCESEREFSFFLPLSKYISVPGGIYEIQSLAEDGSQLVGAPYAGPRAELKVEFAAPNLRAELLCGSKSAGLNLPVPKDGAAAGVVPGDYTLLMGVIFTDKPAQPEMAKYPIGLVVAGKMAPASISAGQVGRLQLGAPFRLEFAVTQEAGQITIKPESVHLYGQAGEEYAQVRYKADPQVFLVNGERKIQLGKMSYG